MANIPGLETWNFLLLLQTFQIWICTSTALNWLSPLRKYYTQNLLSGQGGTWP